MKRVFLFLATNIAILVVLSIVLNLLGVDRVLDEQGVDLDYGNLLVFAAVFGFSGSFISLALSKWMAKRATGAEVIEKPRNDVEAWLVQTVSHQAQAEGPNQERSPIVFGGFPSFFPYSNRKETLSIIHYPLSRIVSRMFGK